MKIKAIILGSTGMVGKGVLLECLAHKSVESVLVINRRSCEMKHDKLKEIIHKDFFNLDSLTEHLKNFNACYFCLGISSTGLKEHEYTRITHDITMNFAGILSKLNPNMTFCFISGAGTDSSEKSRMMWARVKGKTENDLFKYPLKAYMFRPGFIQPLKGIKSSTPLYNFMYFFFKPFYFVLKNFKSFVTNTESVGKAMINATMYGYDKKILESIDINIIAEKTE